MIIFVINIQIWVNLYRLVDFRGQGPSYAGLPTVPYFTVQYRILTTVPSVPYGTENVPFLSNFVI